MGRILVEPGFKFHPTNAELVGYYLYNKIKGKQGCYDHLFVKTCNLYGQDEPWDIWNKHKGDDDDEDLYFFTPLTRKTPSGSRISRRVGSAEGQGTWHGEDSGFTFQVKIKVNGEDVCITGCKKRFNYRNPESDQHGRWIMHEFSCSLSEDIVLCLLRRNDHAAHNNMEVGVKTNLSRKRRLSEFQQDAVTDRFEPAIPSYSKQLQINQEPHTKRYQRMGSVCIKANKPAPVAMSMDDDILEWLDDFVIDYADYEAICMTLADDGPQQFDNFNSNTSPCPYTLGTPIEHPIQVSYPQAEVVDIESSLVRVSGSCNHQC